MTDPQAYGLWTHEALITEIERLREGRDTMGNLWAAAKADNARLRAENERLRHDLQLLCGTLEPKP